jgi:hypothetical protein
VAKVPPPTISGAAPVASETDGRGDDASVNMPPVRLTNDSGVPAAMAVANPKLIRTDSEAAREEKSERRTQAETSTARTKPAGEASRSRKSAAAKRARYRKARLSRTRAASRSRKSAAAKRARYRKARISRTRANRARARRTRIRVRNPYAWGGVWARRNWQRRYRQTYSWGDWR